MTNSKARRLTAAEARAAFIERVTDFYLPTVVSMPPTEAVEDEDRRAEPVDDAERPPTTE